MKFFFAFLITVALSGAIDIRASPTGSSNELTDVLEELVGFILSEKIEEISNDYTGQHDRRYDHFITRDLADDVIKFLRLLPLDEITQINVDYWKNDEEFHKLSAYLKSEKFSASLTRMEGVKEARDLLAFIQNSGVDVYGFLILIHEILGLPPPQISYSLVRITGGIAGYFTDMNALLPTEKIAALHQETLVSSPGFARFVQRMTSEEHLRLLVAVQTQVDARAVIDEFKTNGLDIRAIGHLCNNILGIKHG